MPFPLTAAERFVDFPAHANHIQQQRNRIERLAQPKARALAYIITELGLNSYPAQLSLATMLEVRLSATASFGFREARRELAAQRDQRRALTAAYQFPDAGRYGDIAIGGLPRIRDLIRHRARQAAAKIAYAASAGAAIANAEEPGDKLLMLASATNAALRTLHNNVLEMVGETINLGRTAGAMTLQNPPEYALRSEQLDKQTCDLCTREHGEIYMVGSTDYFAHLPPSNCLGGGRCRGLMIFGYGPEDVRQPDPSEEELQRLRAG